MYNTHGIWDGRYEYLIDSRVIDVSTIELMDLMIDCPLRDAL